MNQPKSFIVYRRNGDQVVPHEAQLVKTAKVWRDGKPEGITVRVVVGKPVAWPELYAGHTQWIADQLDRTKHAIQQERARRAARKQQGANAPSGTKSDTIAA